MSTEALGGSIRVQSELGRGTTFVLRLPGSMLREEPNLPGATSAPRAVAPLLELARAAAPTASTS